jgi:hypothetical protein
MKNGFKVSLVKVAVIHAFENVPCSTNCILLVDSITRFPSQATLHKLAAVPNKYVLTDAVARDFAAKYFVSKSPIRKSNRRE